MSPTDQKALAERIVAAQIALAGDAVFRALFAAGTGDATDSQIELLQQQVEHVLPEAAIIPRTRMSLRHDRVHAMACAILSNPNASEAPAITRSMGLYVAALAADIVDMVDAELARGAA